METPISDISANNYAEVSFSGNSMVTSASGAFKKAMVENAAFQITMFGFSFSDHKLIYEGPDKNFMANILALVCHADSLEEREIRITVFKNGIPINENYGKVNSTGNSLYKAVSFSFETSLSTGDYLEVMVCNPSGTEGIIVKNSKLTIICK